MISRAARQAIILLAALAHYVASAATFSFEDPNAVIIPLDFEINGKSRGELVTRATPALDAVAVEGATFKALVLETAADSIKPIVESLPNEYISLAQLNKLGLDIALDLERLVIVLKIVERRSTAWNSVSMNRKRRDVTENFIKPARLSAYANLRLRAVRDSQSGRDPIDSAVLNIESVVNFNGWAVVGQSSLSTARRSGQPAWNLSTLGVEKDFPRKLWRVRIGDLATPSTRFQRSFSLFGISLAKDFDIDPSRLFQPTGGAQVELTEKATVEVYFNGRPYKTLRLEPGMYRFEDFKLVAGENNMTLKVTSSSGTTEEVSVSEFGAPQLLGKGVSQYAASLGFQTTPLADPDAIKLSSLSFFERAIDPDPVASGFYRRGLTDQITGELALQGTPAWQRLGASAYWATPSGNYGLEAALHSGSAFSPALTFSSEHQVYGFRVNTSTTYISPYFNHLSSRDPIAGESASLTQSIGVSRMFGDKLSASFNGYYEQSGDGSEQYSANLRLGRRFGDFHTSLMVRARFDDEEDEFGGYLSFSWSPARNWRTRGRTGFGRSRINPGIETGISYSNRIGDAYVGATIDIAEKDGERSLGGSLSYQTDRWAASASRSSLYSNIGDFDSASEQTNLEFEWALAYADGTFGSTRHIRDTFAIVGNHTMWKGVDIGVNPTLGGFEHTSRRSLFGPVITGLKPYVPYRSLIHSTDGDMLLERNDFDILPESRRGTKILIGNDAVYAVRSALFYSDGRPVSMRGIRLVNDAGATIDTFTNGVGRFIATGLTAGVYTISPSGTGESATIEILGDETMVMINAITLKKTPPQK